MPDKTKIETTRIDARGIEWFTINGDEECQCARCGSSCVSVDCWQCGGEGEVEHESWDGCGDSYFAACDHCEGKGGWWRCCSGKAWCEAHPMPGREHITTTAWDSND